MENFNLNAICDIIILISAVIIASKNIYNFIKKPVTDISSHARSKEEEHIEEVIERKVPEFLNKYSETVKNERLQETQQMINGLKEALITTIDDKFEDLKEIVLDQGTEIKEIKDTLEKVKESSKDVLRIRMNEIYYKYLPYLKICNSDKQLFDSLYKDYANLKGNSVWESMNAIVQTWTVIDDNYKF